MMWGAFDSREGLLSQGHLYNVIAFAEGLRRNFGRQVDVRPIGDFDFDFGNDDDEEGLRRPSFNQREVAMLHKAIIHGKEKRKPWRGAKAFDRSCCNHKSCEYCKSNRLFFDRKRRVAAENDLKTWEDNDDRT